MASLNVSLLNYFTCFPIHNMIVLTGVVWSGVQNSMQPMRKGIYR